MKLQINLAGSWRDVLHFAGADRGQVEYHAAHIEGPKFEWTPAK